MITGFIIWSLTAVLFLIIGISAGKSKQEAGFFTYTKLLVIIVYLGIEKKYRTQQTCTGCLT